MGVLRQPTVPIILCRPYLENKKSFSYLVSKLKYSQKNTYISLSLMTKQVSIRYGQHSVKITEFVCHADFM